MPFVSTLRKYIHGRQPVIDFIKDFLVSAGWTVHKDLTGEFNYGWVVKSRGADGTAFPIYLEIRQTSTAGVVDFTPHRGRSSVDTVSQSWKHASYHSLYVTGNETWTYVIAAANENSCAIYIFNGTAWRFLAFYMIKPWFDDVAHGVLQSNVSSGSNIVIQLAAGEADNFVAGKMYNIIDGISRNYVTVSAVDKVNHTVTATLSYAFNVADVAMIGDYPDRWVSGCGSTSIFLVQMPVKTNWSGTANSGVVEAWLKYVPAGWSDPDILRTWVYLEPILHSAAAQTAFFGAPVSDCVLRSAQITTASECPLAVGLLDTGVSTGSNGAATLNDTSKAWTTNQFADKIIIITAGKGVHQFRKISSNTATQITVSANWDTTLDETSHYSICNEGWLYIASNNAIASGRALRII